TTSVEGAVSVSKRYPEEFRRKVLDLVAAGRPIATDRRRRARRRLIGGLRTPALSWDTPAMMLPIGGPARCGWLPVFRKGSPVASGRIGLLRSATITINGTAQAFPPEIPTSTMRNHRQRRNQSGSPSQLSCLGLDDRPKRLFRASGPIRSDVQLPDWMAVA
ncbi:hypothetical protein JDV09_24330, partial [Mycobacterium sp. Y57]|nr:hypothetical protein [Mycolicibacterium xanthum]